MLARNANLALFATDDSFEVFAGKLQDPNAVWTAFQEQVLNEAMLMDDLSEVIANLYVRLKKGL